METKGRTSSDLRLNQEHVKLLLVNFLRDETQNAGFTEGVLGLSGGVDSAVCAFLAAEPWVRSTSTRSSCRIRRVRRRVGQDAELVVKQLGIRSEVVEISPMVDPLLESAGITDKVRAGNIMARETDDRPVRCVQP